MKFYEAKVTEIRRETPDIYSYIMDIPEGFQWKAGQHVLWKLKDHEVDEEDRDSRVFTIASAPEDGFLMFTTRIGEKHTSFKEILLNRLKTGDTILVASPLGDLSIDTEHYKATLIIAGGVGITPVRSLLRSYIESPAEGHDITVLYSDAGGKYAFEDFWDLVRTKAPDIDLRFLTKRDEFTGLTDEFAKAKVNDAEYIVAGSPGMNDSFTERLEYLGIKSENIKKDVFMGY